MAYARVNFADNITPLDAAHMNVMDSYIATLDNTDALKVDKDSVVVAATRIVASKLLAADAQPAFRILGDGTHGWGPGGATAPDVSLYRSQANYLKTDGSLVAIVGVSAGSEVVARSGGAAQSFMGLLGNGNAGLVLGSAQDTSLYRSAASTLKTDGTLIVGANYNGAIQLSGAAAGINFGGDPILARDSPQFLGIDQGLKVGTDLVARSGFGGGSNALQVYIGYVGAGNAGLALGPAQDTILYRSVAGVFGLTMGALGNRDLVYGAADSGGAGYRMVRVAN